VGWPTLGRTRPSAGTSLGNPSLALAGPQGLGTHLPQASQALRPTGDISFLYPGLALPVATAAHCSVPGFGAQSLPCPLQGGRQATVGSRCSLQQTRPEPSAPFLSPGLCPCRPLSQELHPTISLASWLVDPKPGVACGGTVLIQVACAGSRVRGICNGFHCGPPGTSGWDLTWLKCLQM
jgi:hypothetical protein